MAAPNFVLVGIASATKSPTYAEIVASQKQHSSTNPQLQRNTSIDVATMIKSSVTPDAMSIVHLQKNSLDAGNQVSQLRRSPSRSPQHKLTFVYNPESHAVVLYAALHGAFNLSDALVDEYLQNEPRGDWRQMLFKHEAGVASPRLLAAIERVGSLEACQSGYCQLACVLVPRNAVQCVMIREYDGKQSVHIDRALWLVQSMNANVSNQAVDPTAWHNMKQAARGLSVIPGVETINTHARFITFPDTGKFYNQSATTQFWALCDDVCIPNPVDPYRIDQLA